MTKEIEECINDHYLGLPFAVDPYSGEPVFLSTSLDVDDGYHNNDVDSVYRLLGRMTTLQ